METGDRSSSSSSSRVVHHVLGQRPGDCARLAVVLGFLVGLEMCMLQFTEIAVENFSEVVRSTLEVVGILLMLVSVVFMVVVSISDNQCVLQIRPPMEPFLADEEDAGAGRT